MKLTDLEPCWLGILHHPLQGVAFNCPSACCAQQRALQDKAAQLEAATPPHGDHSDEARAARRLAAASQPYRIFAAFQKPVATGQPWTQAEQLYEHSGDDFDSLTVKGLVDRSAAGHARVKISKGIVTVV